MTINVHFNVSVTSRDLQTSRLGLGHWRLVPIPGYRSKCLHLHALWPALAIQHTGMAFIRQEVVARFHAVWRSATSSTAHNLLSLAWQIYDSILLKNVVHLSFQCHTRSENKFKQFQEMTGYFTHFMKLLNKSITTVCKMTKRLRNFAKRLISPSDYNLIILTHMMDEVSSSLTGQ